MPVSNDSIDPIIYPTLRRYLRKYTVNFKLIKVLKGEATTYLALQIEERDAACTKVTI